MGLFNDDIISLPEINADTIRDASTFMINDHRSHEELMEIINSIVHGIYYNAKVGVYPENGEWYFEGRIFGIPQAYAAGPVMKTPPPPSYFKMLKDAEDTVNYIEEIFTKLGFKFEYVKCDKTKDLTNVVIISIPFETKSFESFAQRVYAKTISASIVPTKAMSAPQASLFWLDSIRTAQQAKQYKCNYGAI